ncbi:class I SAM-dependent methyltransferase [Ensifer aridi]|uniref:class I SAM-dependent methyltransferase n=1 Tax=Ensifer aridi TaxID=1708715 RepID=UPI001FCD2ACC|nr:class I SAM-dependent methyltransferase [Ensifer aridi]
MPDRHYEDPSLAEIYDLTSGWSIDRDFYLALAGGSPKRILDLGCGTGLLCDAYAALGHDVTGVDPAKAMLDVAKRKPHGSEVEWIEASAQEFRSEKEFDLIIMTATPFRSF